MNRIDGNAADDLVLVVKRLNAGLGGTRGLVTGFSGTRTGSLMRSCGVAYADTGTVTAAVGFTPRLVFSGRVGPGAR